MNSPIYLIQRIESEYQISAEEYDALTNPQEHIEYVVKSMMAETKKTSESIEGCVSLSLVITQTINSETAIGYAQHKGVTLHAIGIQVTQVVAVPEEKTGPLEAAKIDTQN